MVWPQDTMVVEELALLIKFVTINDLGYQIQGDFDVSLTPSLITRINKLQSIPTLFDYMQIFEEVLLENNCKFSKIQIFAFKEFVRTCNLNINNETIKNSDNVFKKIK